MLALNIPDKYAMERMGHATNTMLKTVYQHTFLQKQIEVSSLLNTHIDTLLQHEMQHNKKNPWKLKGFIMRITGIEPAPSRAGF